MGVIAVCCLVACACKACGCCLGLVFGVCLGIVGMTCVNSVVCNSYMFTFSWFLRVLGLVLCEWCGTTLVFVGLLVCLLFVCRLVILLSGLGWYCYMFAVVFVYLVGVLRLRCLFGVALFAVLSVCGPLILWLLCLWSLVVW